jgi:hypothetical protein
VLYRHGERFCNLARVEHDIDRGIAVDLVVQPFYDRRDWRGRRGRRGRHLIVVDVRRFGHHDDDCAGFLHDVDPAR